jgi:hypothetical protein
MTDQRRRIIERAALTGDPSAASALLTERMRDGSLTRERVELAAYCGHEGARRALDRRAAGNSRGPCTLCDDEQTRPLIVNVPGGWACLYHLDHAALSLAEWVGSHTQPRSGLARWSGGTDAPRGRQPDGAHVLVRAMCAAVRASDDDDWYAGDKVRRAVEDAEGWLNDPSRELARLPASAHRFAINFPGYYLAEALWQIQCGSINAAQLLGYEVENCARVAGERAIRDAICASLISWSLGGSPT